MLSADCADQLAVVVESVAESLVAHQPVQKLGEVRAQIAHDAHIVGHVLLQPFEAARLRLRDVRPGILLEFVPVSDRSSVLIDEGAASSTLEARGVLGDVAIRGIRHVADAAFDVVVAQEPRQCYRSLKVRIRLRGVDVVPDAVAANDLLLHFSIEKELHDVDALRSSLAAHAAQEFLVVGSDRLREWTLHRNPPGM